VAQKHATSSVDAGATQVKKTKTGGNSEETTKKGKKQAERKLGGAYHFGISCQISTPCLNLVPQLLALSEILLSSNSLLWGHEKFPS